MTCVRNVSQVQMLRELFNLSIILSNTDNHTPAKSGNIYSVIGESYPIIVVN